MINSAVLEKECFKGTLAGTIDGGFSLLGDLGKQAFYLYLDKKIIKKSDFMIKIEDLSAALEKIFNRSMKKTDFSFYNIAMRHYSIAKKI